MSCRRQTLGLLATAVVVLCVLSGLARPALAEDFYGVNAGGLVFGLPPAERDRHLELRRDAGISTVRIDASWGAAEPVPPVPGGPHVYVWAKFDVMAAAMASHGLRWYPMLGYSTAWSGTEAPNMMSPPARPADFAAFVAAFARRYGRGGTFWAEHPELPQLPVERYELWNEPNYDRFWTTQADAPERYAELYLAARAALHAVDPAATAVVGGIIDFDSTSFIRRMYAHRPDLRGNVDAVGFHPYRQVGGVMNTIARFRAALVKAGDPDVPIELTEIGWFEGARSEASRARLLQTLTRILPTSDLGVTSLIPYVWAGDTYALIHEDGSPMPAGAAYSEAIRTMTGPQRVGIGSATQERLGSAEIASARRRARLR
jgi:polysaccharide biosynthesis protein PslG